MNLTFKRRIPIPMEIKEEYPLDKKLVQKRELFIKDIKKILTGISQKKLVIIGPCSADSFDAVIEYCSRLYNLQQKVQDKILLVPRVFTAKPRSKSSGYLGMLHNPNGQDSDLLEGIISIRKLHLQIAQDFGLFAADEILYPQIHRFLSDLIAYAVIGARSCENQEHRFIASGLDIACGFKNPMSGDLNALLNSIGAAQTSHEFIYRNWEVKSSGNEFSHAILRGYSDSNGKMHANINETTLLDFCKQYHEANLNNPAIIIDCNHANSSKIAEKQPDIAFKILNICSNNQKLSRLIKGFMLESYLQDGCISSKEKSNLKSSFGLSKTDSCLSWDDTKQFILNLAEIL